MGMFVVMMGIIAPLVAGVVSVRCTMGLTGPMWIKIGLFLGLFFIFMSPALLRGAEMRLTGLPYHMLTYTAYFLFVCLFLFFCLMFVRDIGWGLLSLLSHRVPSPFAPTAVARANIALTLVVVVLAAWSLWEGIRVPAVRHITLTSDKITAPLTVAVLPDIHIHRAVAAQKLKGLVARTRNENPDVILLPGDIIDDRADAIRDLLPYLGQFQAPLGVFVSDGNHEFYIGTRETQAGFRAEHLTYLNNEARFIRPDVRIAGVPDVQGIRFHQGPDMRATLPPTDAYTILLAHSPKMFDMPDNTADLQVSGHTHGGQIFPFHLLAAWSNKYLAGLYRKGERTLYVSRGAGQWGPQMRLLAPSEITLIHLHPGSNHGSRDRQHTR